MTTSVHTPLPWFAVNRGTEKEPMWSVMAARIAGQKPRHEVAICATGDSPQEMETANAELIVKCVNEHDGLVAALAAAQQKFERFARRQAYEAGEADDFEAALKQISAGSFPDSSTIAVAGEWNEFAHRLQDIARAALAKATA